MSDAKKILDDLAKQVADLSKAVTEKKADGISEEAIQKRVADLVDAQMKARKDEALAAMRKGEFRQLDDEARKSHDTIIEKTDDPLVRDFQRWNDDVYIVSKLLKTHPSNLKMWNKYAPKYSELKKAMDSATSAEGSDWIPTDFSSDLIERVNLATKVAGLFNKIKMPSDPYKLPTLTANSIAYKVAESTATGVMTGASAFTASVPATGNVSLDATKIGVAVEFSSELTEDSIIPVAEMVKNNIALGLAFGIEDAIINGDTAGTHQDADVTSSADVRKAWSGLRKIGVNTVSLSTFNLANLRSMRSTMGRYGANHSDLAWIVSAKGYVKLLGLDEVTTLEKYGPQATVLSGELGRLDGIPIIVSEKVRDDLNASGVNDATTNSKGLVLLVNLPSFVLGERRKVTMKSFEDVRRDQSVMVATWRGDFKNIQPAADPLVIEGINVTL